MKLFIDTEWYDMIQDLPEDKQVEVMRAIISYPNGDSDTNIWRKVILPKLQKSENAYKAKSQRFAENRKKRWQQKSEQISEQKCDKKSEQTSVQKSNRCQYVNVDVNVNEINNSRKDIKNLSTTRASKQTKQILPAHQEIADYLADNLSVRLNRKISNRGWADEIRKLCESGNIDPPRVHDALEWHFRKYDRPYRIEIQSARTLREKFSRLETAYLADEPDLPV